MKLVIGKYYKITWAKDFSNCYPDGFVDLNNRCVGDIVYIVREYNWAQENPYVCGGPNEECYKVQILLPNGKLSRKYFSLFTEDYQFEEAEMEKKPKFKKGQVAYHFVGSTIEFVKGTITEVRVGRNNDFVYDFKSDDGKLSFTSGDYCLVATPKEGYRLLADRVKEDYERELKILNEGLESRLKFVKSITMEKFGK